MYQSCSWRRKLRALARGLYLLLFETTQLLGKKFSIFALAFGNFVVGLSILLPTGMLGELSLGLDVPIGTVGLLISFGAGAICVSPPLVAWMTSHISRRALLTAVLAWLAFGH